MALSPFVSAGRALSIIFFAPAPPLFMAMLHCRRVPRPRCHRRSLAGSAEHTCLIGEAFSKGRSCFDLARATKHIRRWTLAYDIALVLNEHQPCTSLDYVARPKTYSFPFVQAIQFPLIRAHLYRLRVRISIGRPRFHLICRRIVFCYE